MRKGIEVAKLPALVTAIAEVDGRDRQSVDHVARTIRERGYIPTGKRGGGAAEMTSQAASNLLIALNGADTPKDAGLAIDRFRSLRPFFSGTAVEIKDRLERSGGAPEPMQAVMDAQTFGEALDVLIEGVPNLTLSFVQYALEAYGKEDLNVPAMIRLRMFGVDVTFERYAASIELFTMHGSERRVESEAHFIRDPDRAETGFYGTAWPDRKVRVTIGFHTLLAISKALNTDANPETENAE